MEGFLTVVLVACGAGLAVLAILGVIINRTDWPETEEEDQPKLEPEIGEPIKEIIRLMEVEPERFSVSHYPATGYMEEQCCIYDPKANVYVGVGDMFSDIKYVDSSEIINLGKSITKTEAVALVNASREYHASKHKKSRADAISRYFPQ